MNAQASDVVIRYIRTKNKTRKLATYRTDDCVLRVQHQKINQFLSERFIPSIFTKGYTKGRSIYHNAYAHLYNDYFIMMDIKDFFPHICHKQLAEKIYYEINLVKPNQISRLECKNIVELCSINSRGLPLGFITSPLLSNIYLKEFDGVFYAIGSVPNTAFLEGVFPLNKDKYIDIPEEVSSSHRMYVCGDVNANNKFKQVVTAAADGCNTAMRIIRDIKLN